MEESKIVIYQTDDGRTQIDVRLENETVWLTQAQMVELFQTTKQNASLHVGNVFKEGELEQESTVKEYLTVQKEGLREVARKVKYYNLDIIISVGYRVKSKRGTAFRIWARNVLKDFLVKGYAVNERMRKEQIGELRQQFASTYALETIIGQYTFGTPEGSVGPDGYSLDYYYVCQPGRAEMQNDLILDYRSNLALFYFEF